MKKNVRKKNTRHVFGNDLSDLSLDEAASKSTSLECASADDAEVKQGSGVREIEIKLKALASSLGEKTYSLRVKLGELRVKFGAKYDELRVKFDALLVKLDDLYVKIDDATEGFRHLVYGIDIRETALSLRDKSYEAYVQYDDSTEIFRQHVIEMISAATMLGDLLIHRIGDGLKRTAGRHHKTYGVFAIDRHFEKKAAKVREELLDGRYAEAVHKVNALWDRHYMRMDFYAEKSLILRRKVESVIDRVFDSIKANRRRWALSTASLAGCFVFLCATASAGTVYTYYYHGEPLGTVKDKTEVAEAVAQVSETVASDKQIEVDVNATPDIDITYEKAIDFTAPIDSAADVIDKLAGCEELEAQGYAIRVADAVIAIVDTQETAENILNDVKLSYCTVDNDSAEATLATGTTAARAATDAADAAEVNAASSSMGAGATASADDEFDADAATSATEIADASIIRQMILTDRISRSNDVVALAVSNTESAAQTNGVVVESGSGIDYSDVDFSAIDPELLTGIFLDNVSFAEEVSIEPVTAKVSDILDYQSAAALFLAEDGTSKVLTVQTAEIEVYDEEIPYETITEETDSLYEDESEVKVEGVNGSKQVVASVTKSNGEELSRQILLETVETEPVAEVILKGTKEKPKTSATGHFINPASGRFSSGFGARWGRQHLGIDIAGSYGSTIVASDGGTVTFAGYNSSGYGYLVKIDHGNGMMTYYAHNSSLLVSVGDKVYQGQPIAKMGSTGRSTGNHCHFEIRVGGNAVNPVKYL